METCLHRHLSEAKTTGLSGHWMSAEDHRRATAYACKEYINASEDLGEANSNIDTRKTHVIYMANCQQSGFGFIRNVHF